MPCLADSILTARMRVLSKVGRSSDEVIRGISIHLESRIAQLSERISLPVPSRVTVVTLDGDGFTYVSGSAWVLRREESTATGIPSLTNGSGVEASFQKEDSCAR